MIRNLLLYSLCVSPYTGEIIKGGNSPVKYEVNINTLASFYDTLNYYQITVRRVLFRFNVHIEEVECRPNNGKNEMCFSDFRQLNPQIMTNLPIDKDKTEKLAFNQPYLTPNSKKQVKTTLENDIYFSDHFLKTRINTVEYGRKFNFTAVHELFHTYIYQHDTTNPQLLMYKSYTGSNTRLSSSEIDYLRCLLQ